ncbi:MAG TPA: DUF3108 domain-containing protein [Gemmatimonadaceae bacterium]|nr:DUF3108 domain-containing protein [Gemmatimonadaceae bacterium]
MRKQLQTAGNPSTYRTDALAAPSLPLLAAVICLLALGVCAARGPDDASPKLPFFIGEKLTYDVSLASGARIGQSTMWVEGPAPVRGTNTYVLRFDSRVRLALFTGESKSESWFDPVRQRSLRYLRRERSIVTRDDILVDMFPEQKRWQAKDGTSGSSPTDSSLDELSFIFFLRTLPLTPGANYQFDRHFDQARNPIRVQVVRREVTATSLGELHTVLVEMRVRDSKHYDGEGLIRLNFTEDDCRLPARIESTMPVVGKAIMSLRAENAAEACAKH